MNNKVQVGWIMVQLSTGLKEFKLMLSETQQQYWLSRGYELIPTYIEESDVDRYGFSEITGI